MVNIRDLIPISHKFACYILSDLSSDSIPEITTLDSDFHVLNFNPFELEDHWKEWLGTITIDHIQDCNFLILATKKSEKAEIFDEENKELSKKVNQYFNMLFLQGTPVYGRATALSGSHVSLGIEVKETSGMRRHYKNYYAKPIRVFETNLKKTYLSLQLFRSLSDTPAIKHGYGCRTRALLEYTLEERLHQFVRSIEALVNLRPGEGNKEFGKRAQIFIGCTKENRELLEGIYKVRGRVEHLQEFLDLLGGEGADRFKKMSLQAEIISNFIYSQILYDADLFSIFSNNQKIKEFWEKSENEKLGIWRNTFDVNSKTSELYIG